VRVVGASGVPRAEVAKTATGLPKPAPMAIREPSRLTERKLGSTAPPVCEASRIATSSKTAVPTADSRNTLLPVTITSRPSASAPPATPNDPPPIGGVANARYDSPYRPKASALADEAAPPTITPIATPTVNETTR